MPITAERLQVDVEASTSKAGRDLDQFDQKVKGVTQSTETSTGSAKRMTGAWSAMSTMVKASAGAMAGAIVGKTIMAASDLNEQTSKVGTVFGPQAKIVTSAAQEMADKFGMVKTEFLDAAGGIGLVGKASGLSKKGAAELSVSMAKLAADASSFYNVPVGEALDAMKSGLVGEAEPMRKFGVLMNEATVNAEALSLGLVKPLKNTVALKAAQATAAQAQKAYTDAVAGHGQKSPEAAKAALALQKAQEAVGKAAKGVIPELTEGQKVQARSSLIMKGMKDASGDLAKTQTSVANRVRELRGRLTNMAADLGTKALPAVEKFLTVLVEGPGKIKAFIQGIKDAVNSVPGLSTGLKITAGVITAVFLPALVAMAAGATVAKVKVVAAWVAQQAAAVKSLAAQSVAVLKNIAFYVQYGAVVAAQMAKAAASMAMNAARVVAGWVLMGAQSLIQAARMAAAWVIAMGPVGWAIAAAVAVGVAIYKNWDKIVSATKKAWSAVSGAVSGAWGKIKGWVTGGAAAVSGAVSGAWERVKGATSSAWEAVKSKVSGAWNAVVSTIKTKGGQAIEWVKGLPGRIKSGLGNLKDLLVNAGRDILEGLWNGLKAKWEDVKAWFGSITDMIPDLKGPRAKDRKLLIDNGKAIMQGLKEGLNHEWKDVKRFLQGITKWVENSAIPPKVGDALEKRLEKVTGRVQRLLKRSKDLAKKYEDAVQAHADKVQEKADFRGSAFSGMNSQANVMNSGNTAGAIAASLQAQVAKVQKFAVDLAALAAKGLSKDAIAQVAAAGVDGGSEVASALAAATDAEVASINASFAAIGSTANTTADTLAAQLFDAGIATAQGVVDGLKARQDKIKGTLRTIAQSMMDEVRAIVSQAIKDEKAAQAAAAAQAKAAEKAADAAQGGAQGGGGGNGPAKPGKPPKGPKGGPAATGGGAGNGRVVNFSFTTHNPKDEPQSRTTNKALDRAASLGLF